MGAPISSTAQRDFSRGVYSDVNPVIAPSNSVRHAINFVFDTEYGSAKVRDGSTIIGSQLVGGDNSILGMHNFRDRDNGNHTLLAGVNGTIFNVATGASLRTSMSTSAVMRFETYLGEVVVQNGVDAPLAFNGSGSFTASTALNTGGMPTGIDVLGYKDRIWILQADGTLRGSSIPASPNFNTISWTSGNKTIPIDPDQSSYAGDAIGLAKISGLLLIFKERALYTFNGSATQSDFLYNVGCSSIRSIATGAGMVFFFNPDGIWVTQGSQPIRISRPVQAYLEGMSSSNYASVASHANGKYLWVSIGDVTIDLTTYNNVVLRYSLATQEWAVLSFPNRLTAFSMYIDGTAIKTAYGDSTARVYTHEGTTDNSTAIPFELITHEQEFGSLGTQKDVHGKVMVYSKNSTDMEIQISVDEGDFETIGVAKKVVEDIPINTPLIGNTFALRVIGSSTGEPPIFKGYEFPSVTALNYGVI